MRFGHTKRPFLEVAMCDGGFAGQRSALKVLLILSGSLEESDISRAFFDFLRQIVDVVVA